MIINKLAILRSDGTHACPFGLPIPLACNHVGQTIHNMTAIEDVPEEQRERIKKSNRRVYRHSAEGARCPFADKLLANRPFVVCDYGDAGAGEHELAMRPSPYYPRVFGGLGGAGSGLASIPLGRYDDNSPAGQTFYGIFSMFGAENKVLLTKEGSQPDPNLLDVFYEFAGQLEATIAKTAAVNLDLPDGFHPEKGVFQVSVRGSAGAVLEQHKTDVLNDALDWAKNRIGLGQKVELEAQLDTPFSFNLDTTGGRITVKQLNDFTALSLATAGGWDSNTCKEAERAPQKWFVQLPRAFFRFSSNDGSEFQLQYRKLEQWMYLVFVNPKHQDDEPNDFLTLGSRTINLYIPESKDTAHHNIDYSDEIRAEFAPPANKGAEEQGTDSPN